MAKEDILLRDVINPPLVTKGSALTFAEFDGNMITLYNALVELSQSSNVPAYDNAKDYFLDDYVQEGVQLYKCIVAGAIVNVTPSTNPASWKQVYASDLVQPPKNYSEWEAVLNQSGASAPSMNVLSNGLDNVVSATYISAGKYTLEKVGAFPLTKTTVTIVNGTTIANPITVNQGLCKLSASIDSNGTIAINSSNSSDSLGALIDDAILNATVRIRVYN